MSPSNWLLQWMIRSASSLPLFEGPPPPAKLSPSFSADATRSLAADAIVFLSTFIKVEKAVCKAFLLLATSFSESDVSFPPTDVSNSFAADSPTSPRRDRTVEKKCEISFRGRKPQRPSKGVMAIVISGLWLSSAVPYVSSATVLMPSNHTRVGLGVLRMQLLRQLLIRMRLYAQRLSYRYDLEQER